jgi:hypothetical protein
MEWWLGDYVCKRHNKILALMGPRDVLHWKVTKVESPIGTDISSWYAHEGMSVAFSFPNIMYQRDFWLDWLEKQLKLNIWLSDDVFLFNWETHPISKAYVEIVHDFCFQIQIQPMGFESCSNTRIEPSTLSTIVESHAKQEIFDLHPG